MQSPSLEYRIEGRRDAAKLVFVHGWPDDASLWRHQLAVLAEQYCCVVPTLPNFGDARHEAGGCDFPEIVRRLHTLIESLGEEQVTLVIHDWGAYIGYLYEQAHPERVSSVVALDIGGHFQPGNLNSALMFVSYQWVLASLWLLGGVIPPLGTALTRSFARLLKVPERQVSSLRSRNNYPYFYFWRANLLPWMRHRLLGDYTPQCAVMFIYGEQKPLMFHSEQWLRMVQQSGGRSVGIKRGGHWFMEEAVEETNGLLLEWLEENAASS